MPEETWFQEWFNSPYYHLLYNYRNEDEAFAFIKRLIVHLRPSNHARILDVACGKGRHSRALTEMGFDVTGIDLSIDSINEAKESENDNLHFFQHDMRLPFWIQYFNYAFNFFTSFGYFRTVREHNNSIRTMAKSLLANGIFVMDYLNVHYEEDHLEKSYEEMINGIKFKITKWHDAEHFFKQIQVEEKDVTGYLVTEKVAKFTLGDFTGMFACQGLQIQEVYGDYKFADYDIYKSPRLIMIAKKIRN
jgi:2-polyprenyl-3-methyl-5-hydroxy-6-metoxy-1,4-benzoquinol methylase